MWLTDERSLARDGQRVLTDLAQLPRGLSIPSCHIVATRHAYSSAIPNRQAGFAARAPLLRGKRAMNMLTRVAETIPIYLPVPR